MNEFQESEPIRELMRLTALVREFEAGLRRVEELLLDEAHKSLPKGLLVSRSAGTATLDGKPLRLSKQQSRLLILLTEYPGSVIDLRRFEDDVLGADWTGNDSRNRFHYVASKLRGALEEVGMDRRWLHTAHDRGYFFGPP